MVHLAQIILLLGVTVAIMIAFQRLHIPSSLGYLLVGLILGPHTAGPTVYVPEFEVLAEFGVVFLLFSIGLNYSLPQLHAMRHQILGLGTAQVVLTTAAVGILLWLAGLNAVAAFVVGAVFAQSSSTIIGRQLIEQGEDNTSHGRLGLAISVFQDVTAVPFLVVIPVLGAAIGLDKLVGELGWAMAKAVMAFALVFYAARWALRPLFHMVAERRSAELFTLTVLLVALAAAWMTSSLGLSLAFGAFLAGMMLGETEFRHQVESSIRPFRDVLLGLFFVGVGMLIDPAALPRIWPWALLGTLLLLLSKIAVVVMIVRRSGMDSLASWRTAMLLAVGGGVRLRAARNRPEFKRHRSGHWPDRTQCRSVFDDRGCLAHPIQPRDRQLPGQAVRRIRTAQGAAGRRASPPSANRWLRPGWPYHRGAAEIQRCDLCRL